MRTQSQNLEKSTDDPDIYGVISLKGDTITGTGSFATSPPGEGDSGR